MKIRNATDRVRLTWNGKRDIQPGDVIDTDVMADGEADWHLRHGFEEVGKALKPAPRPVEFIAETTLDKVVDMPNDPVIRRGRGKASRARREKG